MTRLINIDNGGTLTDFCLIGGEVRYTKALTTPCDLSRCLSPRPVPAGPDPKP
jgi:N-methylhydantoinase A/oxoprolinase/acetone carboxylase beta subunit